MGNKARFVDDVIVPIVSGLAVIGAATGLGLMVSGLVQHNDAQQTKETIAKSYAASSEIFHEYLKSKYNYYNNEFQNDNMTAEEVSEKINAETSTDSIINHWKQNPNVSSNEHKNVDKLEKTINDSEHRAIAGECVAASSLTTAVGMEITSYVINKRIKKREKEREM